VLLIGLGGKELGIYTRRLIGRERERPGGLGGAMHEEITGDMQRDMGY
jgi:hypothetical protein